MTLGAADGIMALLRIAASDVNPDGGVVGEWRSGSPLVMPPGAAGGAGGGCVCGVWWLGLWYFVCGVWPCIIERRERPSSA